MTNVAEIFDELTPGGARIPQVVPDRNNEEITWTVCRPNIQVKEMANTDNVCKLAQNGTDLCGCI